MHSRLLILALGAFCLSACPTSHGTGDDAGPLGDGGCGVLPPLFCVTACGSDAGLPLVCSAGRWSCPPGSIDASTCPPGCAGPRPYPECTCEPGRGGLSWSCATRCPPSIEPWNPASPGNVCFAEGATCSNGGSACGVGLFCTCNASRWNCAVAEPDPVCTCGREPMEGDPCSEPGTTCGECCPTVGGTGWPMMQCVDGRWQHGACPDVECPELWCPADTRSAVGQSCSPAARCGDPCCGTAIVCVDGRWQPGPIADCEACLSFPCGPGSCRDDQYCRPVCEGIENQYRCEPMPSGCRDCSCIPLLPHQSCDMVDGHPLVTEPTFCV